MLTTNLNFKTILWVYKTVWASVCEDGKEKGRKEVLVHQDGALERTQRLSLRGKRVPVLLLLFVNRWDCGVFLSPPLLSLMRRGWEYLSCTARKDFRVDGTNHVLNILQFQILGFILDNNSL